MRILGRIGILAIGLMAIACSGREAQVADGPTSEMLLRRVSETDRLTLGRMTIKKTASVDDVKLEDAKGTRQVVAAVMDALKIGDRKAVYSYDTYLTAYIDLSEIGPDDLTVDTQNRRISVTLPRVKTEFAGREAEFHEEHYRVTGLRSAIGSEERARLKENMNSLVKEEVRQNAEFGRTLEATGRRRAETFFRDIFAEPGYEVSVSWK